MCLSALMCVKHHFIDYSLLTSNLHVYYSKHQISKVSVCVSGCLHYSSLPYNPLYTHLTPDTPQRSHTLSSQVLAAADLSTNTCWGQLNLWTSGWKNTSTEEREDIWRGGGGGDRNKQTRMVCAWLDAYRQHTTVNWHMLSFVKYSISWHFCFGFLWG